LTDDLKVYYAENKIFIEIEIIVRIVYLFRRVFPTL